MDTPPLSPGQQIAGYTLESLIGRGGIGEVYRGVDLRLARAVAVKVLAPEYADDPASKSAPSASRGSLPASTIPT